MITQEQIRAARAMLDWSTADLSKATGIPPHHIYKIERGHVIAPTETLEVIKNIFELYGVEFIPGDGLKKRDNNIIVLKGATSGQDLAKDIYNTLKDVGGEVLIAYSDEKAAVNALGEDFLNEQVKHRTEANIWHRILSFEKTYYKLPNVPATAYRCLPEKYFSASPFFIYGSKLALYSTTIPQEVVIINDARFAESARVLFNLSWDISGRKLARP